MKPLFTEQEFNSAKSHDKLPCMCIFCGRTFYRRKATIVYTNKLRDANRVKFCSHRCKNNNSTKKVLVVCKNCGAEFSKRFAQIKKSPSHFCSRSCAAIYNNKHKTYGTRRSKLEKYIQEQLTFLYPELVIEYNCKSAIGSELDIYVPSLRLAFELNGIYHFEPIYGTKKLTQIQSNDSLKFKACQENGISLCVIDSSSLKHFREDKAKVFLDIIIEIVNSIM